MLRERISSEAQVAWAHYEPAEFPDGPLKASNEIRHAFTSGWIAAEQSAKVERENLAAGIRPQLDHEDKIERMVNRATELFGAEFVVQHGIEAYLTELLADDVEPNGEVNIPVIETEDAEGWPDYAPTSSGIYQAPTLDSIRTAD